MTAIGFIGLGHMGHPMARNLLKAGHSVKVYDVVPQAAQSLVTEGAKPCAQIAEVATGSEVLITMVQTGQQVRDVCLAPDGLFAHAKPGVLYMDCSSIDITVARALHDEAKSRDIAMIDAPVSGGVAGAAAATLTFMVGGEETHFIRAKSILAAMGKKIVHAGPAGTGQAAKICNNLILGISMIGVCEGFALGKKLGLDPKRFFEISSSASGQCWSMTSYCPAPGVLDNVPSSHDYQPGFMAKMMLKDLYLAQQAAQSVSAALPLGAEAAALYALYVAQGHGEVDFSGIMRMIEGVD
ncbi:MAG: 3-hydroxyisobutyrate dehydrogenase [Gammaproteobacteria bacterium RIFCSPHIGHO2_12_FULL_41_20]|nr:MAG: 3-hydroxyisobutyrate dehydrogenase [Gammaproteobacteria bacterium RIFCSPHIGHO2_12_FULL_41_20]